MDKVEKRKEILSSSEKKMSEKELERILSKKKTNVIELDIREPLEGNVNLAILMEKGFANIEILRFSPGNITSLKNIPSGLKQLILADNLLDSIDLPDSIEYIDIAHNLLKGDIDFVRNGLLKYIRVSYNQLSSLSNLQENTEELYCDHNVLRSLNLKNTPKLSVLHCDYNPKLILHDLPDTIVESRLPEKRTQVEKKESVAFSKEYLDSILHYFKMKNDYEIEVMKLKRKAKESKRTLKTLPPCKGCSNKVGMIFSGKDQKYSVYCGNANKPCDWKMVIHRGDHYLFTDTMMEMRENLEETKENMIRQKMDTLFQYITEQKSAELFKKQLSFFKTNSEMVTQYEQDYHELYFSKEKKEIIALKQKKIQELLIELQEKIIEGHLDEIVHIQYEKIQPIAKYIQNLEYPFMEMEFNEKTRESRLVQNNILLSDLEINHGEPVTVEKIAREKKSKKDSVDMFFNEVKEGDIFDEDDD